MSIRLIFFFSQDNIFTAPLQTSYSSTHLIFIKSLEASTAAKFSYHILARQNNLT